MLARHLTALIQHALNEDPALIQPAECNMFNIQLNYNYNQALDPESWDGNFHVVSLHRSMEHLASDAQMHKTSRNPSLECEDTF